MIYGLFVAAWCFAAAGTAVVLARAIRIADERERRDKT